MSMLVDYVRRFRGLRALVVGDAMLDTYLEGTATRLCREGPVPVVRKVSEHHIAGGAANTAANLHALGADVIFLSIVGRDNAASMLRAGLREQGIDDRWMVEDDSANTLHKLRILADGQYIVRFDEDTRPHSPASKQRLLANLDEAFARCDLVLVSDYDYGVLSDELIDRLRALRSRRTCPLLVDSKNLSRFHQIGASVITPNHFEAWLLVDPKRAGDASLSTGNLSELDHLGQSLLSMIDAEHAAITLAADGVFLANRRGETLHIPAHPVTQANDVGAGDSFAAALSLALAAGAGLAEAGRIAIEAASIAVTKHRTSIVRHQELLQRVSLRDQAESPETSTAGAGTWLPESLTLLAEYLDTARQQGRSIVFTNGVFDILHAGHVQFLRQAKALGGPGGVLVVGVNSDSSTRRLKGKGRPINSERDRMALVAALDAVDHVVLFEEDTPIEAIRALRPHIHVKGGDYADEALPEAEAVHEVGGSIVILPLAGSLSTSKVIDRIVALASGQRIGVEQ